MGTQATEEHKLMLIGQIAHSSQLHIPGAGQEEEQELHLFTDFTPPTVMIWMRCLVDPVQLDSNSALRSLHFVQ